MVERILPIIRIKRDRQQQSDESVERVANAEVLKFVTPILLAVIGAMLTFFLTEITGNQKDFSATMSALSNDVSSIKTNVRNLADNVIYDRQRLDSLIGRQK